MSLSHHGGWSWGTTFLLLLSFLVLVSLSEEAAFPGDPCSGLVKNGCFDKGFNGWEGGGNLPVSIVELTSPCDASPVVRLGVSVPQVPRVKSSAWISQTITIPLQVQHPLLTFCYDIFTNTVIDWSAFHVQIQEESGEITEILRDGYEGEYEPDPGTELGWRHFAYDLTPYRGRTITLRFGSTDEWEGAYGIWTLVDGIKIFEGYPVHLPVALRNAKPPTPTTGPKPFPTETPTPTPGPSELERRLMELINQERASQGPWALAVEGRLMQAARRHSQDMATNDFVRHTGSDGSSPLDRMWAAGYPVGRGNELLAADSEDPSSVLAQWMQSTFHHDILMDPEFVHIGVGYAFNSDATYDHYWTVNVAHPPADMPTGALAPAGMSTPSDLEHQLVDLINQERVSRGLSPLTMDGRLMQAARRHSEDMATSDFFGHTGSDGSNPIYRMRKAGYPLGGDELLAAGTEDPADVLATWMASPAQSDTLMDPDFVHIGVSHVHNGAATHGHYWTVKVAHPPVAISTSAGPASEH
ncbi:MAG TPA: CAP domain-containing protein [Anaerolineae bacterium]|nr:CAP domain-containing protein [Anaerolineae bacterium]